MAIDRSKFAAHRRTFDNTPAFMVGVSGMEKKIIIEYPKDFNFKNACRRAGMVMNRPDAYYDTLQNRLSPLLIKYLEHVGIDPGVTAGRITKELALIAFHDPKELFDKDGLLKSFDQLGDMSRVVQEITIQDNGKLKVKLYSKKDALDTLAKAKGMFQEERKNLQPIDFHIEITVPDANKPKAIDITPKRVAYNG